MGDFAHLLHIRPWELPLLTVEEFLSLIGTIDATQKSNSEGGE